MAALDQSICSASRNRFRSSCWNFAQTPAWFQSCSLRQQVTPEPQPISCGSISQGMPLFRTKMMPVRQARFGIVGRPPLGFGLSRGRSGSMISHSSSGTSGVAMLRYPCNFYALVLKGAHTPVIPEFCSVFPIPSSRRFLIGRAGFPATTVQGSTFLKTLERAPTTAPSPILTPGATNTSAATQAPAPIKIGAGVSGICGCSKSWLAPQR